MPSLSRRDLLDAGQGRKGHICPTRTVIGRRRSHNGLIRRITRRPHARAEPSVSAWLSWQRIESARDGPTPALAGRVIGQANGTQGPGDDHSLTFSQVELRGLEPLTPACKAWPRCPAPSMAWHEVVSLVHLSTAMSRCVGVGCGCHRGPLTATWSAGGPRQDSRSRHGRADAKMIREPVMTAGSVNGQWVHGEGSA